MFNFIIVIKLLPNQRLGFVPLVKRLENYQTWEFLEKQNLFNIIIQINTHNQRSIHERRHQSV
jgi:hypothetical protein